MIVCSERFLEKFKQHTAIWKAHWYLAPLKRQWRWKKQNNLTTLSFNEWIAEMRK